VQVSTLRKLLGPQAIQTVPGRGYRFIEKLDDDSPVSDAMSEQGRPQPRPVRRTDNLPTAPGPLHGRDDDLEALDELLAAHHVVTIVGPGGMGKTRIALAVAQRKSGRFPDGVWWIELAPIVAEQHLAPTIAAALSLNVGAASDPRAGADPCAGHARRADRARQLRALAHRRRRTGSRWSGRGAGRALARHLAGAVEGRRRARLSAWGLCRSPRTTRPSTRRFVTAQSRCWPSVRAPRTGASN
jgi:hypothetical protein